MQPKKVGTTDFPYIDAFSTFIDNTFVIECNYCEHHSMTEEEAEQHFTNDHHSIFENGYPKKHLDEQTGKFWNIPLLETVQNNKKELEDGHFYISFNSLCSYEQQPLNDIELKAVEKQPNGIYIYKEELLLPKTFPKPPKPPKPTKDQKLDKIKHIYSYNVGASKVEGVKKKLIEQGVQEKDIYTKENRKGNYFVYYYK